MRNSEGGCRKYLYLLVSHPNEDYEGLVESRDASYEMAEKNEVRRIDKLNPETAERFTIKVVSLGYHDFETEDIDGETFAEASQQKLAEIDTEHLRTAGLDPEEVAA